MRAARKAARTSPICWTISVLISSLRSTSMRTLEPPCRSRPRVTGRRMVCWRNMSWTFLGRILGSAKRMPASTEARMAKTFQREKNSIYGSNLVNRSLLLRRIVLDGLALGADFGNRASHDAPLHIVADLDQKLAFIHHLRYAADEAARCHDGVATGDLA